MAAMSFPRISRDEERRIEEGWDNDDEAHVLLDLVNAEFSNDPMSQQCFDRRIVERVALCVAKRKLFEQRRPFL